MSTTLSSSRVWPLHSKTVENSILDLGHITVITAADSDTIRYTWTASHPHCRCFLNPIAWREEGRGLFGLWESKFHHDDTSSTATTSFPSFSPISTITTTTIPITSNAVFPIRRIWAFGISNVFVRSQWYRWRIFARCDQVRFCGRSWGYSRTNDSCQQSLLSHYTRKRERCFSITTKSSSSATTDSYRLGQWNSRRSSESNNTNGWDEFMGPIDRNPSMDET